LNRKAAIAMLATARQTRRAMPRPGPEPDESTYLGRIAKRLKGLREQAGLDSDDAAAAITRAGYEVSAGTIYRWERGETQPHVAALPAIATAYKLSSSRIVLPNE
jgi:DNA-binding XRE family transcriptional regulator